MNRRTSTKVLVVILVFIALSMTTANALPCSYDICVNQSGWWPANGAFNATNTPIQLAINNATAGNTIYVYNDTYNENVDISTASLTLKGEGRDVVTVTAKSIVNHIFNVTANYVNISGFNVTGATGYNKAGIYLNGVSHCNISNNTALNNYYGIYLDSSSSNSLTNNTVSDNTHHGIYLRSSSNNNISNNTVNLNSYRGIELYSSSNNNITCNWLWNNVDYGFRLSSGSIGNNISYNNIIANGVDQGEEIHHYQVYNDQSEVVNATSNWWGTNNATKINESIYDKYDDGLKGIVNFSDYRSSKSPCAPIPELTTVVLISLGLLVLAGYYRIRRKA